ncbi:MAG: hypothetical protein DHS20C18_52680 [Saprospiraceae bacterium]|nr:MAG: hypothetical protein DHS20C18_52680 [Saprospiraceae bacterium]
MAESEDKWELDFEWLRVRHLVKERFNREALPDLNAILYLIGIQELGRWQKEFTKEEKQDLIHIAACRLLTYDGYYEFQGRDADGWPHFRVVRPFNVKGLKGQERILKESIIQYFRDLEKEIGNLEEEE